MVCASILRDNFKPKLFKMMAKRDYDSIYLVQNSFVMDELAILMS